MFPCLIRRSCNSAYISLIELEVIKHYHKPCLNCQSVRVRILKGNRLGITHLSGLLLDFLHILPNLNLLMQNSYCNHGSFDSINQTFKLKRCAKFGYFSVLKQMLCSLSFSKCAYLPCAAHRSGAPVCANVADTAMLG